MNRPFRRFATLAAIAAGILLVAIALAATGDRSASAANPTAVVVTNPAAQPVPVTGSVQVTGSVSLEEPLLVTTAEAGEVFGVTETLAVANHTVGTHVLCLPNPDGKDCTVSQVPAGKRFVVEHVSALTDTCPGVLYLSLSFAANSQPVTHYFPMMSNGTSTFVMSQDTHFYLPGGALAQLYVNIANPATCQVSYSVSGRLVDEP